MTQKKTPKIDNYGKQMWQDNASYSYDMFRGQHPCDFTEKQWIFMMKKAYPDVVKFWK